MRTYDADGLGDTCLEDAVDVLVNGRAGDAGTGVPTHQRVDRRDDARHLRLADGAVAVDVVQVERPAQLVVETSTSNHRQTHHEVLHTHATSRPPADDDDDDAVP